MSLSVLPGLALGVGLCAAAHEVCQFENNDGVQCRALGDAESPQYNGSWCVRKAHGRVQPSCVQTWAVPSGQQIFEEAAAPFDSTLTVDWAAQRGEAEHAQLALRSFNDTLNAVDVTFSGELAPWLSVRQVGQVFCNATFVSPPRGAGWWPDPLLPMFDTTNVTAAQQLCQEVDHMVRQGRINSSAAERLKASIEADLAGPLPPDRSRPSIVQIAPGQTAALWLTLAVPLDASPGRYTATATVIWRGQATPVTVHLSATVWNLTLPPLGQSAFTTFFQFQYQSQTRGDLSQWYGDKADSMKSRYFELLCDSRIPPIGYSSLRSLNDMEAASPARCSGTVGGSNDAAFTPTAAAQQNEVVGSANDTADDGEVLFSIMSVSDLFGHVRGTSYNASYLNSLWEVLDPVVAELNQSGLLRSAGVYGFDEAHPKEVYEPLIAQLFGAIKQRYDGALATIATLHYCPDLTVRPQS